MKWSLRMGILLVLSLACIGVVSANLVSNGGFENPGNGSCRDPIGQQIW